MPSLHEVRKNLVDQLREAGFWRGVLLVLVLTLLARQVAGLPHLALLGPLVVAILLGIAWRGLMGLPDGAPAGIRFASKTLLRWGVGLMGVRLDFNSIVAAGPWVILLDVLVILLALVLIPRLARRLGADRGLCTLVAVGTAVCGASAVAAAAPITRAREEQVALAVAIVSLVGTLATLVYSLLQPLLPLTPYGYGVFAGSTLHEVGHVVAAALAGGPLSGEIGIVVKLGRVALLPPVLLLLALGTGREERKRECTSGVSTAFKGYGLPVPWFVLGFLTMSLLRTGGLLPGAVAEILLQISIFLLTLAMAGLGLGVEVGHLRTVGLRTVVAAVLGWLVMALGGYLLLEWFGLNV